MVGTLLILEVANETLNEASSPVSVILGVVYKKPALIIFLKLHQVAPEKYSLIGHFTDPSFVTAEQVLDDLAQQVASPHFIKVTRLPPSGCYENGD